MDTFLKGTKISLTNREEVIGNIKKYNFNTSNYICIFGLYPLVQSHKNEELEKAYNNSIFNPLHGKSIEFYLRLKGHKNIQTVDGVYLLTKLLNENLSHYFYGTNNQTLGIMRNRIKKHFPSSNILGYKAPPLQIDNNKIKDNAIIKSDIIEINQQKPNIVWIGLGGIKQDLLMYHYSQYLNNSLMIGVGAAFNYFAGNLNLSSELTKILGLRWFHRLVRQPQLFSRYVVIAKYFLSYPFKKHH